MNIWDECVRALKEEKGAYLILIATILPLIFGFAGFAVDMGNYQAHSAKLQHAADSAALAGAVVYAANDETEDSHASADEAAEKYLKANLGSGEFNALVDTGNEIRYQVKTSGDVSYYRVYIKENLDTTFIRLIGAPFFTHPQGEAIATIPVSKGGGGGGDGGSSEPDQISFNSLFSFSGQMWGTFNNNNGDDKNNFKSNIQSTYDGDIYCFNPISYPGYASAEYYRFYTGDARDLPRYEANAQKYYHQMQEGNPNDFNEFTSQADEALKKLFDYEPTVVNLYGQNCNIPGDGSISNYYRVQTDSSGNLTLNISNVPAGGDSNSPIYIYVDGNLNLINVNLQENITRPVLFCYSGTRPPNPYWAGAPKETEIHFSNNDYDFRGVVYTPYATCSPFNFENGTFTGTIVTHDLELQSNHGKFVFEQFGIPLNGSGSSSGGGSSGGGSSGGGSSGGGSGGGGSGGVKVDLKLVPDPGLGWEG